MLSNALNDRHIDNDEASLDSQLLDLFSDDLELFADQRLLEPLLLDMTSHKAVDVGAEERQTGVPHCLEHALREILACELQVSHDLCIVQHDAFDNFILLGARPFDNHLTPNHISNFERRGKRAFKHR